MLFPARETFRGILINEEGKLGLVYAPDKDRYETAGGGRNGSARAPHDKETAWECLQREIGEETGYSQFEMVRYLGLNIDEWTPWHWDGYAHLFLLKVKGQPEAVRLDPEEEGLQLRWWTPEALSGPLKNKLKPGALYGVKQVATLMKNGWDAPLPDKIIYSSPPWL
ncbi:MAG TPA: NUDIX hydrolase [archaeon]|nr:NUDIX hydrolase [archaeon]